MRKPNATAKLLNLPEEQQAQLAEWLLNGTPYHKARELVLAEFGVSVSLSAFQSFWQEVCAPALLARRKRAVSMAGEVADEAQKQPGRFDAATVDAIKQKAFELAISPMSEPKDVKALFMLLQKGRDQDIKAQQLDLEKEKYELKLQEYRDKVESAKKKISEVLTSAGKSNAVSKANIQKIQEELKLL